MSEHGFYHATRGYWQTTDTPGAEILAAYPAGTVEVPLRPSADHQWQNGAWVYVAPPPPPVVVPDMVAKLALVRAMRMVTLQGAPAGAGPSAWDAVKAAIAGANEATQEDWQLATHMPRAEPMLNALSAALGVAASTLDAVFILADQIDRGEVAP